MTDQSAISAQITALLEQVAKLEAQQQAIADLAALRAFQTQAGASLAQLNALLTALPTQIGDQTLRDNLAVLGASFQANLATFDGYVAAAAVAAGDQP